MEIGEGNQDGAGEIAETEAEDRGEGKAPAASEIPDSSASKNLLEWLKLCHLHLQLSL